MTDSETTRALSEVAGSVYAGIVKDQLSEERLRKTSLEQRALSVVATSGALATLLFGLAAFAVQSAKVSLNPCQRYSIVAAVAGFLVAAVLALLVQIPLPYHEAGLDALNDWTKRAPWQSPEVVEAAREEAVIGYFTIKVARFWNGLKAWVLFAAIFFDVLAIAAAAVAAAATVIAASS
jgi:hypothetical protein